MSSLELQICGPPQTPLPLVLPCRHRLNEEEAQQQRQRFFMGHTAHVVCVAFDGEGSLMASAQEGKQALVRVWDFRTTQCLAILNGEAKGLGLPYYALPGNVKW